MSEQPAKGRADFWAAGDWNALCAQCGRKRKASTMIKLPAGVPGSQMYVCPEHWEPRHPQDFVRAVPDNMSVPWSQPPGVEGAPLLNYSIDTSIADYVFTISSQDAASGATAGNPKIVITIQPNVIVGTLDISAVCPNVAGGGQIVILVQGALYSIIAAPGCRYVVQVQPGGVYYNAGFVLTAGNHTTSNAIVNGFAIPPESFSIGSLNPGTLNSSTIYEISDVFDGMGNNPIAGVGVIGVVAQNFFNTVKVNGVTLASAVALYSTVGGNTFWLWVGSKFGMTNGSTYAVAFT